MKTRRTPRQWQKLIASRDSFAGTTTAFCQQHGISTNSFYKHRASLQVQSTASFVQVKTITEQTRLESHGQIQFDVHSGKLTLPTSMAAEQMIAIIKGLSQ